ncbi:MAG TPA: beta-ketoacyl-ACP reductase [Phycisphaerales bacterium]|nr:beta-ketoacyl-ACP reductase [Phycisphaerales bacterium]HMP37705.1 beta-ketoacyl-ACP reductase [Phycisphaerales bacterium]
MKPLEGKVSLVTGGARGIGRAIALGLAEAGSDIALNYLSNTQGAEETREMIRRMGRRCEVYQGNVADDETNHVMGERIHEAFGLVQIVVNNAGITRDRSFGKMSRPEWDEVLGVNLTGPALITHLFLPKILASGWGRIVNITSVIGQMGNFGQTNYAAAKGGLIAFTKSLAREVARKGVTVNCVAPGFITTDMTAAVPEKALKAIEDATPVGRLGNPEEVAAVVTFLASPAASFITGQEVGVNGGLYM